jgi:hypothetical protein
MLGWLAAAAAPVLIHLWNRRKYREEPWAAVEFLLAAMKKNAKRIQVEQLILLTIRTAIVILVVLAVARPLFKQLGLASAGGERTLHVLVIDGSYSMDYRPTDKSRFQRAKEIATQIVDDGNQGDGYVLVLMGEPPRVVVGTPAFSASDFIEEIENLQLPHAGGDLAATLEKVEEILSRVEEDDNRLTRSQVYFLTDLGRTTWQPDASPEALAEIRERVERVASRAGLAVIDLGQTGSENVAVTRLEAKEPYITISQVVNFEVDVHNFGRQDRTQQVVELLVDGRRMAQRRITLPAGETASAMFSHRFETPGDHQLEVRVAGDLLDVDNHRYLAVPVKEHLSALCVNSKQPGSADYLALALEPDYKTADRPLVRPHAVTESALWELELTEFDCVFLCNIGRFNRSEAKILQSYLRSGGALVFYLGDQVITEAYNDVLFDVDKPENRVLPARLESIAPTATGKDVYLFDPLEYRHPIAQAFRGRESAGLLRTPVFKYIKMKLPEETRARTALAFAGSRDPAIVEESIHRGRSIMVALPCSTASKTEPQTKLPWTPMPMMASFLPVVQEILAMAVSNQIDQRNVVVSEPIGGRRPRSSASAAIMIQRPDGKSDRVGLHDRADDLRWVYDQTSTSGVYTAVIQQGINDAPQTYAVNVDPRESDLTKVGADDVVAMDDRFETWTEWQNLDAESPVELKGRGGWHRDLLMIVLALMMVETALAWWFGNRAV